MTRRLLTSTLLSLAVLATPAAATAADTPLKLKPKNDDSPLGDEKLSNERTVTRWGHTNLLGGIRKEPSMASEAIGKLRWNTEDGLPEVYLVLESRLDDKGGVWLKLRIPRRPNGSTGWVREEQISNLKVVTTHLTIDRTKLRATLRRGGKVVWSSPIGVGAPGTVTPAGKFWIRERLKNLGGSPIYGPWAFGTAAYSDTLSDWPGGGVVGIHGTNQPELIPGRPSHGCIRVPNARISRLAKIMPVGTPVKIK
jgi:hypothetical protein